MAIPLMKVHMHDSVVAAVSETLKSGFVATGAKTDRFEEEFGKLIGNKNVVAVNCGTSAIQLALYLAGASPEHEVISTAMTCLAVNEPVIHTGATLVWADVDPRTGNIDVDSVRSKITPRTKVLLFSHWCGRLANVPALNALAREHNLLTIEDAASALGGQINGTPVGSHSDYTTFSFQAVKHLTTGDGGMLAVRTDAERQRALLLRNHGNDRFAKRTPTSLGFDVAEAGWKYQMNDIAASMGVAQLPYLPSILETIDRNTRHYEEKLGSLPGLTLLKDYPGVKSYPWLYSVLVENREGFVAKLREHEIGCSIAHERNDTMSVFERYRSELPNLDYFAPRIMNLPVGFWVTDDDVSKICKVISSGW